MGPLWRLLHIPIRDDPRALALLALLVVVAVLLYLVVTAAVADRRGRRR